MCNRDSFDLLLGFGNAGESVSLNWRTLSDMNVDIEAMTNLGMLREIGAGSHVECAGCGGYIPVLPRGVEGEVVLFADCPECGMYKLAALELKLWRLDFTPLLHAVRRDLSCSGAFEELIPDVLWSLGRAAVAGQSRGVFVSGGINSRRNAEIIACLPEGKTPILLVIGDAPRQGKLGSFQPDRVFAVSELVHFEVNRIAVDVAAVAAQLDTVRDKSPEMPPPAGKNAKVGDLAIKLKNELRHFMCGIYSAMEHAERSTGDYCFNGVRQTELAAAVGATPVAVNRALKKDMELKALFDAANNPRTAYAYGKKAMK